MSTSMPSAAPFVPERAGLPELRTAAADCQGCPLYREATQTVFGAGGPQARLVLVGEQPGDLEDLRGQPFVGPVGRVLDRALAEAGIKRDDVYVTNAVKHFKFTRQATRRRRIHQKPTTTEMVACRPWLVAELRVIEPEIIIALGATAAKALLGPSFLVAEQRGIPLPCPPLDLLGSPMATTTATVTGHARVRASAGREPGETTADGRAGRRDAAGNVDGEARIIATIHPSVVLRATDRDGAYAGLVADLAVAARLLP